MKAEQSSPVLDKTQLQERLGVSSPTATKLLRNREFPNAFQVLGRWRVPVADVEAFIEKSRQSAMAS